MKKVRNILIWGTAVRGKVTFDLLEDNREINIIAFGDNDIKKQGNKYCGKDIFGVSSLKELYDLDCIIIASQYSTEIYNQLKNIVTIPIYFDVWELINMRASIEISGWCNGRCKWCATGIENRTTNCIKQEYMSFDMFKSIYNHLNDRYIFNKFNEIILYNWGEPFLNPDCMKIMEFLSEKEQVFSTSTNASILVLASKKDTYKNCRTFIFSMSGFSQSSYDYIHGFNFERIKENIKGYMDNLKMCGFKGEAILSYHVYQFNQDEVNKAKEFAVLMGLKFVPVYAYIAGYELTEKYLNKTLPSELLKEVKEDLLLHHVDDLLSQRPDDFQCLEENFISINSGGGIELCSRCENRVEEYEWGSVFNIIDYKQWKSMRKEMLACNTCRHCRELGVGYWAFYNPEYTS